MKAFFEQRKGRVEGRAKVTGAAKYSAEYNLPGLVHGVLVGSRIASGKITKIYTQEAIEIPGVIDVLSYWNKPHAEGFANEEKRKDIWHTLPIFYTDRIYYNDQHIALVVAETLEDAIYAASLIKAEYVEDQFEVDFHEQMAQTKLEETGEERGSQAEWQNAEFIVDEEYRIAMEVHNPMEMHATIAHWTADDQLTLYDKTQGVNGVQRVVGGVFDIPAENIHVISEYVGGGFGSGLRPWPHTFAAAMAAKQLGRPVKVVLSRPQMFTNVGFRPESWQRFKLGADKNGRLLGALHQSKHTSSYLTAHNDRITRISRKIYGFENLKTEEGIVTLNIPVPIWMRGPGDATGCFAMECAIDELCVKAGLDPVEVRLQNIAPHEMETGNPWSSHFLDECLKRGAKKIGWKKRPSEPGALKDGEWKIGYGHAVGLWNAGRNRASASLELKKDGSVTTRTAMTDIGTGTGEAMVNITQNQTGIPRNKISIELGDSDLPPAPSQGGSTGLSSLSGAIGAASNALKKRLAAIALNIPENNVKMEDISYISSGIRTEDGKEFSFEELVDKNGEAIKVEATSGPGEEREKYGFVSSGAHFCIVRVHEKTGRVKVDRFVSVVDGGTIINEQAAANQIIGAVVGGIGMALLEEQEIDQKTGRLIGNDLAGYHFAVNASAPMVEVEFINKPDPHINPSGAKGLGEVGIIGNASAIANAIYNATGKRFRDLPITPDKILGF